ncbi:uncharacterized membrane protein YhaH (DUF805 family) [Devosia sp. UYZn731]|uniref:DUF805 domain-containing protein n=1 Tax=unclassified Devosia TaxID=196773 RepID=UPI002606A5D8|nr:DUF805 domain-containing protein [Devosia sp.]MDB5587076.1 hypothetical protein [Devosia sp.]
MDWIRSVYLTRDGRVSRKTWWLGVIGLFVAGIVLTIIFSLVGLGATTYVREQNVTTASAGLNPLGNLVVFVLLAYPSYCLSIKRRHDRDKSGIDFQIWFGLGFVLTLLGVVTPQSAAPVDAAAVTSMIGPILGGLALLSLALAAFAIYILIVLGFLRGTVGNNSYGADPAGGTWAPAA